MTLQDHQISFITKWQVVRSLEKYAAGEAETLELVNLDSVAKKELATDEGMDELRRWLRCFHSARAQMAKFEATCRTTQYNRTDWRIADNSVTTILSSLERLLIASAIDRVKPKTAS